MSTTLYRPVGLHELALIWDSGCRSFPPRLAHQPIFYPVANEDYARQIARDWNLRDEASGYCGFVTCFDVESSYIAKFPPQVAGSSAHVEYWIPAAELVEFNRNIHGEIRIGDAYFATDFQGYIPTASEFCGKNAQEQFLFLTGIARDRKNDLRAVAANNRKAIFLHYKFWQQTDFASHGVRDHERDEVVAQIRNSLRA